MNTVTQTLHRPGRRSVELDPFAAETHVEGRTDYGCVDWYVYGEEKPTAAACPPPAPPASAPGPQAPTQPH